MIRIIKLRNKVFRNIEPYVLDDDGQKIWNIPATPDDLKDALLDTLGFITSEKIISTIGDVNKKDAGTSKALVLLAKIVDSLNPNLSILSKNEKESFKKMVELAASGYSDSDLLKKSFEALENHVKWYAQKYNEVSQLSTLQELITFAEKL